MHVAVHAITQNWQLSQHLSQRLAADPESATCCLHPAKQIRTRRTQQDRGVQHAFIAHHSDAHLSCACAATARLRLQQHLCDAALDGEPGALIRLAGVQQNLMQAEF